MPLLTDCTATLRLVYDRGPDGYGVPVSGSRFMGTVELWDVLLDVRYDLATIGWWDYIESVLTAGVYVNKPGAHGDGIAWDFDGVVLKGNPLVRRFDNTPHMDVLTYKDTGENRDIFQRYNPYREIWRSALHSRIRTRFDCLVSLRFGVVLTQGYNKAHADHGHYDLSRPVKWRSGSRSQVILLQETLNAFYDAGLVVDGKFGYETDKAWKYRCYDPFKKRWLAWLKMIAFNPPKDVPK